MSCLEDPMSKSFVYKAYENGPPGQDESFCELYLVDDKGNKRIVETNIFGQQELGRNTCYIQVGYDEEEENLVVDGINKVSSVLDSVVCSECGRFKPLQNP